ncbi:MAG: hypothetical protein WDZ85_01845 [Candidatus Paceibacterota bacterium]
METENLMNVVWFYLATLTTMGGLGAIIWGWCDSCIPFEAYYNRNHPRHIRAQEIYSMRLDKSTGFHHRRGNDWNAKMACGWLILSWVLAGFIFLDPYGLFIQDDNIVSGWQYAAKIYLVSHLFVIPIFFYFVFFSLMSFLMVDIIRLLTRQPKIEYRPLNH